MTKHKRAKLRACASCEWIFNKGATCPLCGFGSYGARYIYGNKCYRYQYSQVRWFDKRIDMLHDELRRMQQLHGIKQMDHKTI